MTAFRLRGLSRTLNLNRRRRAARCGAPGDACREFRIIVEIEGQPQTLMGIACPNGDGTWSRAAPEAGSGPPGDACREFRTFVEIEGQPQTLKGIACPNGDGTWSLKD